MFSFTAFNDYMWLVFVVVICVVIALLYKSDPERGTQYMVLGIALLLSPYVVLQLEILITAWQFSSAAKTRKERQDRDWAEYTAGQKELDRRDRQRKERELKNNKFQVVNVPEGFVGAPSSQGPEIAGYIPVREKDSITGYTEFADGNARLINDDALFNAPSFQHLRNMNATDPNCEPFIFRSDGARMELQKNSEKMNYPAPDFNSLCCPADRQFNDKQMALGNEVKNSYIYAADQGRRMADIIFKDELNEQAERYWWEQDQQDRRRTPRDY